jgi:hypothetical protein
MVTGKWKVEGEVVGLVQHGERVLVIRGGLPILEVAIPIVRLGTEPGVEVVLHRVPAKRLVLGVVPLLAEQQRAEEDLGHTAVEVGPAQRHIFG